MRAIVHASALASFKTTRDEYATYLKGLSNGDNGGQGTLDLIEAKLQSLANTLSMWMLIRHGTNKDGVCFEARCNNLRILMKELALLVDCAKHSLLYHDFYEEEAHMLKIFRMASIQIGSLNLQGLSNDDREASANARLVELEQKKWARRSPIDDDWRLAMLREYWTRFYFKVDGCLCGLCLGVYVQHRDPSLSPPLPPLPDLSTDYVTSSEEE
jgi:hypothetical protein